MIVKCEVGGDEPPAPRFALTLFYAGVCFCSGVSGEAEPRAPGTLLRCARRPPTPHRARQPGCVRALHASPRIDSLRRRATYTYAVRYIAHVDSLPHASAWGLLLCAGSKQAPARTRMTALCSPKRPASRGPTHTPNRTRALTSHMPAGRSPALSAWLPHRKRP